MIGNDTTRTGIDIIEFQELLRRRGGMSGNVFVLEVWKTV